MTRAADQTMMATLSRPVPRRSQAKVWVARNLYTLDALAQSWSGLLPQAYTPTQDFSWIRACAETFASEGRLSVLDPQGWRGLAAFFSEGAGFVSRRLGQLVGGSPKG
jgi:hypothetical protein